MHNSIHDMPTKYPMFCESQCLAWSALYKRCMKPIVSQSDKCPWDDAVVKDRIRNMGMINGTQWWKKKKVSASKDKEESINNE